MFVWFRALLPCYKCNILLCNCSIPPGSHITIFKVQHFFYLRWKCIFRPSIRSADRKQAAYLFPHHLFTLHSPQDVNGAISAPLIHQCVREGGRERERRDKSIIVFRLNWWTLDTFERGCNYFLAQRWLFISPFVTGKISERKISEEKQLRF